MQNLYEFWKNEGENFAHGVALLGQYAPKAVTSNILKRLQDCANANTAPSHYELGKLTEALQSATVTAPAKEPGAPSLPESGNLRADTYQPDPVPTTTEEAKRLHKRHAHLHATMVNAQTDEERADAAEEIMERVVPSLDSEYDRLRAGNSDTPTATPAPVRELTAQEMKRLHVVRTRLSKLKKQIPQTKDPVRRAQLENEFAEKTAEKENFERL
jgi:hypothetical protein